MYGSMYYSYSPSSPSTSYNSTPAMEIPSASSSARPTSTSSSCAYPSWPRRASLSSSNSFETANSYISDDELFPLVFDDAESESSASPMTSPTHSVASDHVVGADHLQSTLWMKELMAEEKARKHREREASKRRGRSSSSRKSSSSSSSSKQKMAPITE